MTKTCLCREATVHTECIFPLIPATPHGCRELFSRDCENPRPYSKYTHTITIRINAFARAGRFLFVSFLLLLATVSFLIAGPSSGLIPSETFSSVPSGAYVYRNGHGDHSSFLLYGLFRSAAALTPASGLIAPRTDAPTDEGPQAATGIELRMAYGATQLEGKLNVRPIAGNPLFDGAVSGPHAWGSACSYGFKDGNDAANVVCSQLGYGRSALSAFVGFGPAFTKPSDPVWLDSTNCSAEAARNGAVEAFSPTEPPLSLGRCRYHLTRPGATNPCYHSRDVGVRCVPPPSLWEFKLVNSTAQQPTRGLVLMRPSTLLGEDVLPWGTVHRSYFENNIGARRALCRSMGLGQFEILSSLRRGPTAAPIRPSPLRI